MIVVAVLRGGPSDEHASSIHSGAEILKSLAREQYRAIDIYVDKQGVWHVRGAPTTPDRALMHVDVVVNALTGSYGGGTVQRLLELHGIPYTGSGVYASALSQNKLLTKQILSNHGIKMPQHIVLTVSPELEEEARKAFRAFSPPVIVKPARSGSSLGVTLTKTFDEFWEGIKKAFTLGTEVMVEEFIPGREATAGVIEGLRSSPYYQLIPVEVHVPTWGIYDEATKRDDLADMSAPGNFSKEESAELQRLAKAVHEELGLRHYSRSDFVVSPRGIYFLESNAQPSFASNQALRKSLSAVGVSTDELIDHMIELALTRR